MIYLSKDNITLAIAIFGALGTITTWILNYFQTRRNISMQIVKICRTKKEESIIAYLNIQNHSRLPISINSISLIIDKTIYPGFHVPTRTLKKVINQTKDNEIISTFIREHMTMSFPINLGSLSGLSGYVQFDVSQEASKTLSTLLIFRVSTNRGKELEMKLPLASWENWDKMF